jgi:hypothetical protein
VTYYETGMLGRPITSFLVKPEWIGNVASTGSTNGRQFPPYPGEQTGGSQYVCASGGLPGLPHIPKLGNQFHGIGDTFNLPNGNKYYTDDCIVCGTRIENKFSWETLRWEGWRPTVTVPPLYLIEEEPW